MNNKQIKQVIASVTGGEWSPNVYGGKHILRVVIPGDYSFLDLANRVSAVNVKYGRPVSIKASEVNK